MVEIVALPDFDPSGRKILRLGGVAGQADQIAGGQPLQEMLESFSANIAGCASYEDLGHDDFLWTFWTSTSSSNPARTKHTCRLVPTIW